MTEQTKSTDVAREEYRAPDYTRFSFEPTGLLQMSGGEVIPTTFLGMGNGDITTAKTEWGM